VEGIGLTYTPNAGRPKSNAPYRLNLVRVAQLEDTLERILNQLHPNSPVRKIVNKELNDLRSKENQKVINRSMKKVNP